MLKALIRLAVLGLLLGPVLLLMLLTETRPLVATATEATPQAALETRALVHRIRAVSNDPSGDRAVPIPLSNVNSAIAFGARLIPGLRGEAEIVEAGLRLRFSAPVPKLPQLGWLNAEVVVPPFDAGPRLAALRVGHLELPPALSLRLGARAVDLALGNRMGQTVLESVPRLEIGADRVTATLDLDAEQRSDFTRRVAGLVRGSEMPTGAEIQTYYVEIRDAIDAGALPDQGSFLPYLVFALERARARATPGREANAFTAAVFALTQACGARDFRLVVGRLVEGVVPDDGAWTRSCDGIVFAGRIDTKRHFVTAAAIKAASTMDVSFTIGEFKELFDTIHSGGFDFTDIVANASGIRFAETMMRAPLADWPALIARLRAEPDVLASFDGVPGLLAPEAFEARFGKIDSPRYAAMVERIERRIDALALHAPLGGG